MNAAAANKNKKIGMRSENPDPVDIHVGTRLRLRRNLAGMSQEQLGKSLGLTFQQIQKYERGVNRMGSSRLFQMAQLLSVPVSYFFDEMPAMGFSRPGFAEEKQAELENAPAADHDVMRRRETLELVRAYYRITDEKQRRKVYELIKSMADEK